MASLPPAPETVGDVAGRPRFGAYAGRLRTSRLGGLAAPFAAGPLKRLRIEKRWRYGVVASPRLVIGAAVVRLGYLGSGFFYVFDRQARQLLADKTWTVPAALAEVGDEPGSRAQLRAPRARLVLEEGAMEARLPGVSAHIALRSDRAPPALTAICPVGSDRVTTTQKRCCVPAEGELVVGGEHLVLEEAFANTDDSHGYLLRETSWRWASASGRTPLGHPIGLNLVEGHNDGAVTENAVWLGGALHPLGRVRFTYVAADPRASWRIEALDGSVALRFDVEGVRSQDLNRGIVASQYVQPVGRFFGDVTVGGARVELAGVPGVTEAHRAIW